MPTSVDQADVLHTGVHTFDQAPVFPAASIGGSKINTTDPLPATASTQQHVKGINQAHGTAAIAERRVIHVARAAGNVIAFETGPVVAAIGDSTATVDLRKNGTTILTGTITIDSADAAFTKLPGVIATAPYVLGDVFEVVITIAAGTGTLPQGVFASAVFREGAGA